MLEMVIFFLVNFNCLLTFNNKIMAGDKIRLNFRGRRVERFGQDRKVKVKIKEKGLENEWKMRHGANNVNSEKVNNSRQ